MNNYCKICEQPSLQIVNNYELLPQVTSDCKPFPGGSLLFVCSHCGATQKHQDAHWQNNCSAIYQAYTPNAQADGLEPAIFSVDGVSQGRSVRVCETLFSTGLLPVTGTALDVGCGNGGILRVFSKHLPQWTLAGQDIDDKYRDVIFAIPGVREFTKGDVADVCGKYDAITMIHTLEHIPQPVSFLSTLRQKLTPNGLLVINIPFHIDNPFDLAIADHSLHFTPQSLTNLLRASGFEAVVMDTNTIRKEIICFARISHPATILPCTTSTQPEFELVCKEVQWLENLLEQAVEHCRNSRVLLFGSSIAASWLFGKIGNEVVGFVDEDERRTGKMWLDRPISHPREHQEFPVLIPLAPCQLLAVTNRLRQLWPHLRVFPLGV